jgi:hypothetical protein
MTSSRRSRVGAALSVLAAAVLAACGGGAGGGGGGGGGTASFLTADPRGMTTGGEVGGGLGGGDVAMPGAEAAGDASGAIAREIEQAEIYRVEGDLLYLLNAHRGLAVVDLATVTVVGRLPLAGHPNDLYVRAGRALVVLSEADGEASLVVADVADPAAPAEVARFPLGGAFRASRIVGAVLYVATDAEVASFLLDPVVSAAGTASLPHGANFVHATDAWLAVSGWDDTGSATPVTLVDVSDPLGAVAVRGTVALEGWIADEQKMDVAGGVLRVVTHDWTDGGLSRLYTVSLADPDAPAVLATLPMARGEQLFATRFTPDAAYVVTFEQVDPLWVVDLRDPAAPEIVGSLIVPGWSTHLVPTGDGRLLALGIDPLDAWSVIASLFDVSDPTAPSLSDRVSFAWGWSSAIYDVKGFGVFPAEGLVTVPFGGATDQLAVLALGATTLDLRGAVEMDGTVLRGFPHPRGLVGVSLEQVVVVDPVTLAPVASAAIAENVVDGCRLPDGTLLPLVAKSDEGLLGDVALPLVPSRLYPHGWQVAVVGWDFAGRAAYVVDFSGPLPLVSERFELGGTWYGLGDPVWGAPEGEPGGYWGGGTAADDAVLTDDGLLVVHGLPGGGWFGGGGGGGGGGDPGAPMPLGAPDGGGPLALDGFVVIDVANSTLEAEVTVEGAFVTGFVPAGGDLLYTHGRWAEPDAQQRPRMRHDLVRLDLATRASTTAVNVPGYVVAAPDGLVFTVEERWTDGWAFECTIVALSLDASGAATVLDRATLPEGAYDVRAAGATLFFATTTVPDGGFEPPPGGGGGDPAVGVGGLRPDGEGFVWPTTRISTLRLGAVLVPGPFLEDDAHFVTLLLAEEGACLTVRDGTIVTRHDVSGPAAVLSWSKDLGAYPPSARGDGVPGAYLIPLGYGGLATAP